jgi:short subunit dehydrogenase-like uncharacterized protein
MRRHRIMIYGANGFTGGLIALAARELPCEIILAGRNAERVERAARSLGFAARAFLLDKPSRIVDALAGVDIVLNSAGPFMATAGPLIAACLDVGAHYLDVAGELGVFTFAHRHDATARRSGAMIMPGVGFSIVASDCLAADVAALVPGAKYLRFGVSRPEVFSRGSLRTAFSLLSGRIAIRRAGRLGSVPVGRLERNFNYGKGERASIAISMPDVFTAYFTTAIPNIEAYVQADLIARAAGPLSMHLTDLLRATSLGPLLDFGLAAWPERPSSAARGAARQVIVAEAEDQWRRSRRIRMVTSDGYSFTAAVATMIMKRIVSGEFEPGFQTPGKLYGAEFPLSIAGTYREDFDERPRCTRPPLRSAAAGRS